MPRIYGYQIIPSASSLIGPITLLDAQASPVNLISYSTANISFVQLQYGLVRNGVYLSGLLTVATDGGSNTTISDSNATTALAGFGVQFSAVVIAGNLWIQYTTTSTGFPTSMTYYQEAWNN
jgi:hypothetical protein